MTQFLHDTCDVSSPLIEVLLHNQCITKDKIEEILKRHTTEKDILNALKTETPENYNQTIDLLIQNGIIDRATYDAIFLSTKEENIQIEKKLEKNIVKDKFEPKERIKPFTRDEIDALIEQGANLFTSVPGHLLPKDNNVFYAKYQLYRFIDSGASDFFLQTRKGDGKIWYEIQFRITGENETQDQTVPAYPNDTSKENLNIFFAQVRKWMGSTGGINPDARHFVQDGGFSLEHRGKIRDFRLSAVPVRCYDQAYPRYAIRLTSEGNDISFDTIKMFPFMKKYYEKMIQNKIAGTIIITGPTGSGKTTTIYGMLNKVDAEKLGVLSIEKPIESRLRGIHQTEEDLILRDDLREAYNLKLGVKGVLRQALDLIFVGEMRDREEVQETIKAGLVGNKLITTFHTNSCVDTILRLQEEGLTRNAIGNGVKYITAQRLIPTLCPHCSIKDASPTKKLEKMRKPFERSKRNLQSQIMKSFLKTKISDLSDIEIILEREFHFLTQEDIDGIVDEILSDKEGLILSIEKNEVAEFLIKKTEMYPNKEARIEFENRLLHGDIRIANEDGCEHCRRGYAKIRTPIFEVLELDKSIRRFIQDPDSRLINLEDFLLDKGFVTLRNYGFNYVLSGEITYDDLVSITE